ncbi:MAG: AMP-binding protein [Vicinamibacterales bacterium]
MPTSRAPWLAHYDPSVPATLAPYPSKTILDYVSEHARTRPDATALIFKNTKVTWRQLERESDAFASALAERGVVRGDRVGLLLPNCPQFFVAELGAWKLGAIVAPLNVTYTEHELEGPLRENGVETIVTLTRFYDRVRHVRPRTPLKRVIVTNIKEYFPPVLKLLFTLVREKKDGDRVTVAAEDFEYRRAATCPSREDTKPCGAHARRSGRAAHERRDDRDAEGSARASFGVFRHRTAGGRVVVDGRREGQERADAAAPHVPRVRERRRPGARVRHRVSDRAGAQPARSEGSPLDDQQGQAGVPHRRPDAVGRHHESPLGAARKGRHQVDQESACPVRPRSSRTPRRASSRSPADASSKATR